MLKVFLKGLNILVTKINSACEISMREMSIVCNKNSFLIVLIWVCQFIRDNLINFFPHFLKLHVHCAQKKATYLLGITKFTAESEMGSNLTICSRAHDLFNHDKVPLKEWIIEEETCKNFSGSFWAILSYFELFSAIF